MEKEAKWGTEEYTRLLHSSAVAMGLKEVHREHGGATTATFSLEKGHLTSASLACHSKNIFRTHLFFSLKSKAFF